MGIKDVKQIILKCKRSISATNDHRWVCVSNGKWMWKTTDKFSGRVR